MPLDTTEAVSAVLEVGPVTQGLLGLALIGFGLAALGALSCLLLRVKLRGPLLYDPNEAPSGVGFRLLAHLAVPATALLCAAALAYVLGI